MNLKNFLKPDWRKILVFAIIFIFSLLDAYSYETYGRSLTISGLCIVHEFGGLDCNYTLNPLLWIFYNVETNGEGGLYLKLLTATYFIPLIYWYILSCFIIWVYDKVRKK